MKQDLPRFQEKLGDYEFRLYSGPPPFACLSLHQIHSSEIIIIDKNLKLTQHETEIKADGWLFFYNHPPALPVAIKTADCLPIWIKGELGEAFLHAGWRGMAQKMLLHPNLDKIKPTQVYIGPCIHQEAFLVTPEFFQHFPHVPQRGDTFDLVAEAKRQVHKLSERCQIPIHFKDSLHCTTQHSFLHSYRRDKDQRRNWNLCLTQRQWYLLDNT
jgi:copper oxidase (laccase) domain-containing protein